MALMKLTVYLLKHTRKHSILLQNLSPSMSLGLSKNDVALMLDPPKNTILLEDTTRTRSHLEESEQHKSLCHVCMIINTPFVIHVKYFLIFKAMSI